jgi:hypothetical protein
LRRATFRHKCRLLVQAQDISVKLECFLIVVCNHNKP